MKNKLVALLVFAAAALILGFCLFQMFPASQQEELSDKSAIVRPPALNITKYKGIWMPAIREVRIALNDIDNLRLDGINIAAIGIKICKNSEFYVCEDEEELRNSVNEFHKNGIKTFLVMNPAHPDSGIDPNMPEASGKELFDNLTQLVLEWAGISEKYGVEMFCPVNEPQMMSYGNEKDVSDWAQYILPKIRKIYSGRIAFEVQGAENRYNLTGYDYIADGGLTCTKDIVEHPEWIERLIEEEMAALKANYPGHKYLFFGAGAFTGPDYYWWEPVAPENMKNNPQGWPEDFFNLSFESQADFYDMFFNITWNSTEGYIIPVYKGWEYRNKPAEDVEPENHCFQTVDVWFWFNSCCLAKKTAGFSRGYTEATL